MKWFELLQYSISFLALYITIFFIMVYLKYRVRVTNPPAPKNWQPRITVIIPAYNEEASVKKCILSVINADYPQALLEVLVIDDGSTDRTAIVASSIKHPSIRVITKRNSGKAASMNFGIAQATGEVIATLDADSFIEKDTIKKMVPLFESEDVVAVTAAVKAHAPQNVLQELQKVEYLYTLFSRKVLTFIDSVQVTPGPFSMFRAWVFKKIGGFDEHNILEDQEIALRIQKYNYKIRSSLDATVYTEIPATFAELLKQRTRWHRGGLRNAIKYLNTIGPHYGDFGMIIMPLGLLAVISIFGVIMVSAVNYSNASIYANALGVDFFALSLSPIHIISAIIFILTLLWIAGGIAVFKTEKVSPWMVFLYIVTYSYLVTIFWFSAIIKELKTEKLTW